VRDLSRRSGWRGLGERERNCQCVMSGEAWAASVNELNRTRFVRTEKCTLLVLPGKCIASLGKGGAVVRVGFVV